MNEALEIGPSQKKSCLGNSWSGELGLDLLLLSLGAATVRYEYNRLGGQTGKGGRCVAQEGCQQGAWEGAWEGGGVYAAEKVGKACARGKEKNVMQRVCSEL